MVRIIALYSTAVVRYPDRSQRKLNPAIARHSSIDAPRARLWDGRRVDMEGRVEADVMDQLRARGHDIQAIAPFSMSCGGMQAIALDPASGALTGAADSRRDGAAMAV